MTNDLLTLNVENTFFEGWKRINVVRSIESISGSFSLEVSDRSEWPIAEEDACSVLIGKTKVITGYVDAVERSLDKQSHSLMVEGRDRTSDLVDCSAYLDKWEFNNISLPNFVSKVCEPFGIPVTLQSGLIFRSIAKVTIEPGDTAFDAIDRACRKVGVLPISDGVGGLVLARAGTGRAKTALIEGQNILSGRSRFDRTGRFFQYFALGQHRSNDSFFGTAATHIKAFAEDANVRRVSRILLIRPEGNVTNAEAQTRVQWEAKVRAGRGDTVFVTVQGWTQSDGSLWPLNSLVQVKSASLKIDGQMLITEARHSKDEGGTLTDLTLRRPDAFLPEPVVTKAKTGQFKSLERGV